MRHKHHYLLSFFTLIILFVKCHRQYCIVPTVVTCNRATLEETMLLRIFVVHLVLSPYVSSLAQFSKDITCETGTYPPPNSTRVKSSYVIDLDLPPEQRWLKLGSDKKAEVIALATSIKNFISSAFGPKAFELIDKYVPYLLGTLPYPFVGELMGLQRATGMPLGEVILFNIFYEVFTVCTSIVAEDTNGTLYHARNLDFGLFLGWDVQNHTWAITEVLRPMVVDLDFQRGGKTLFKSVNFAGYIGLMTAMKPDAFSITLNERFQLNGGFIGILEWLIGDRSSQWSGFLLRQMMENVTTFAEAEKMLVTTKLIAPVYFILGGNSSGQGSLITKDRASKEADVLRLTDTKSKWFILETNYDHWAEPPFFDDRRTSALQCLNKTSQKNISFPTLFDVLSTKPNLNKLTVYTALMQVNSGSLETYIQTCSGHCSPW